MIPTWDLPERISVEHIESALTRFHEIDDVYCPEFAAQGTLILVHLSPNTPTLDDQVGAYIESSFKGKYIYQKAENKEDWKAGPYFLKEGQLHQAWRLYVDELETFVSAIIPSESDPEKHNTPASLLVHIPNIISGSSH